MWRVGATQWGVGVLSNTNVDTKLKLVLFRKKIVMFLNTYQKRDSEQETQHRNCVQRGSIPPVCEWVVGTIVDHRGDHEALQRAGGGGVGVEGKGGGALWLKSGG